MDIITPQLFGAVADGVHDDTDAIRAAFKKAEETTKSIFFPAGTYITDVIEVPMEISVKADSTWSYSRNGSTIIKPLKENQECVFEISNSIGTSFYGVCLVGDRMGENMHGFSMCREKHTTTVEHSVKIDSCRVNNFSGNGINLVGAWAVSIRHSQSSRNGGNGVYLDGCDAFVIDNWFSSNEKSGFAGDTWNSAVNFTSNRVEWNGECGLQLLGGMRYNVTGNYFDRTFGPAIKIQSATNHHKRLNKDHTVIPYAITVTGNNFVRSGAKAQPDSDNDCHIFMKNAAGITITSNTFNVWKNDGRDGRVSPGNVIIVESCAHSIIADNVMLPGATKNLIVDRGGHGEGMIIKDNTGAAVPQSAWNVQDPFTPVHFMMEGNAPWYSEKLEGESNE